MPQIILWKIGSNERPATEEDINHFMSMLNEAYQSIEDGEGSASLVCHHNVICEKIDLHHRGHSIITAHDNDVIIFKDGEMTVKKRAIK
jgi:hypothetical protein